MLDVGGPLELLSFAATFGVEAMSWLGRAGESWTLDFAVASGPGEAELMSLKAAEAPSTVDDGPSEAEFKVELFPGVLGASTGSSVYFGCSVFSPAWPSTVKSLSGPESSAAFLISSFNPSGTGLGVAFVIIK